MLKEIKRGFRKELIYTVLVDVMYYFILYLSVRFLFVSAIAQFKIVSNSQMLVNALEEQVDGMLAGFLKFSLLLAGFVVVVVVSHSFFKSYLWALISKQKYRFSFYMRFFYGFIYGLVILVAFYAIGYALLKAKFEQFYILALILLYIFFVPIYHCALIMDKENRFWHQPKVALLSLWSALHAIFHRFLWYFIYFLIVVAIFAAYFAALANLPIMNQGISVAAIIIFFTFLSLTRIYMFEFKQNLNMGVNKIRYNELRGDKK